MDRFCVGYDAKTKQMGYMISRYFLNYEPLDLYSELTIFSANNTNMEFFLLEKVNQENLKCNILVVHFLALYTSFFKKTKGTGIQKTIVVDHNQNPLPQSDTNLDCEMRVLPFNNVPVPKVITTI